MDHQLFAVESRANGLVARINALPVLMLNGGSLLGAQSAESGVMSMFILPWCLILIHAIPWLLMEERPAVRHRTLLAGQELAGFPARGREAGWK
jgi:hypothetical protein